MQAILACVVIIITRLDDAHCLHVCTRECRLPQSSGLGNFAGFLKDASPDSYKAALEGFRRRFCQGLEFVVLTPVFLTLRQQTSQRLKDAGLQNSDGSDPKVIPYQFATETTVRPNIVMSSLNLYSLDYSLTAVSERLPVPHSVK